MNLNSVISKNCEGSQMKIMTSYFTLFAFKKLKDQLYQLEQAQILINPNRYDKDNEVYETQEEASLKNDLNYPHIAKEFAQWLQDKAKVRKVKSHKISGKMLCLRDSSEKETYLTHSDFDAQGVGLLGHGGRVQLNEKITDEVHASAITEAFDFIWGNSHIVSDIKDEILEKLKLIYQDQSPELLYFFTLNHLFSNFLEENQAEDRIKSNTGIKKTLIWQQLYDFQRDGVIGAINKIEKFGGCIIADSVGLGKTFEALAIIKYYELRAHKVLVLAPKKLRDNWLIYKQNDERNPFVKEQLFSYTLLNHTDLSRDDGYSGDVNLAHVPWWNFDLVVIDESHNFRNASTGKDRMTRYEKLMRDVIQSGVHTKVLMLSATPVNKALKDIKNQIAFITKGQDNALADTADIDSIANTLKSAQTAFNIWSKLPENEQTTKTLLDYLNWDYFRLLDSLTIARSRKHIEKYYSIEKIGKFPTRLAPINHYCEVDKKREFPLFAEVNEKLMSMSLCMYTPLVYVVPERRAHYAELLDTKLGGKASFKQTDREFSLKALMRTNIFKRLESSIYAFDKTIHHLISSIEDILDKLSQTSAVINNLNAEYDLADEEVLVEGLTIGKSAQIKVVDIDKVKYEAHLRMDLDILQEIAQYIALVTHERDDKLIQLKSIIAHKIAQPLNACNKKIIIFTAFADTAYYLYESLYQWAKQEFGIYSACVTGAVQPRTNLPLKRKDFADILINFSPLSKKRSHGGNEIDLLFATDCISEGQNLQDCDYLINYDIHWNPVRIIQRFGRIDRIGSINKEIQLVNFWPAMGLDEYINLEQRVRGRMKLLDISATGEENIIEGSSAEMKDLAYRKEQLKQLRSGTLDIEELAGGISITDLTLNDYRTDLSRFTQKNPKLLEKIPTGIFALTHNENFALEDEISPGVIFCMKSSDGVVDREHNILSPYMLVYVTNQGEVRYADKQIRHLLDLYRSLCLGKRKPIKELLSRFKELTNKGARMTFWQNLLAQAVSHIKDKQDEHCGDVFSLGGLSSFGADSNDIQILDNSYELISFLIIM